MKKTEGYLCLKCLKTFTSEIEYNVSLSLKNVKTMFSTYYTCPVCNNITTNVDEKILDAIIRLNKLGFKTRHCCEGHPYSMGYISFTNNISIIKPPVLWEYKDKGIRVDFFNYTETIDDIDKFNIFKEKYIKNLYDWIDEIEKNNDGTIINKKIEEGINVEIRDKICEIMMTDYIFDYVDEYYYAGHKGIILDIRNDDKVLLKFDFLNIIKEIPISTFTETFGAIIEYMEEIDVY